MIKNFHPTKFLLAALLLPSLAVGQVNEYQYDKAHSSVGFSIVHLTVSKIRGFFDEVDATISLDPSDLTTLKTEVVIQTTSVNTNNESRDDDLRDEKRFDVENYPEITFKSTKITDVKADGTFKLHGDFTMKGITRPVVFDAEMRGPAESRGWERLGFSAKTEIDRFDYGIHWNAMTEAGGLIAGREVEISIEVEAKREL